MVWDGWTLIDTFLSRLADSTHGKIKWVVKLSMPGRMSIMSHNPIVRALSAEKCTSR